MKFRNYQTLLTDLITESYHPFWPSVLEDISEDDFQLLAYSYWKNLELEAKQSYLMSKGLITMIDDLLDSIVIPDIDDSIDATAEFMKSLRDFFIDEICSDLEKEYFAYEFNILYGDEDRAYEAHRYKNDIVNG